MTRLAIIAVLVTVITACNKSAGRLAIVAICSDCELRVAYGATDTLMHVRGNAGIAFTSDTVAEYGASIMNFQGAGDGYLVINANGKKVFEEHRDNVLRPTDRIWYIGTFIPDR